jgi:hypothetical protein
VVAVELDLTVAEVRKRHVDLAVAQMRFLLAGRSAC